VKKGITTPDVLVKREDCKRFQKGSKRRGMRVMEVCNDGKTTYTYKASQKREGGIVSSIKKGEDEVEWRSQAIHK